MRFEAGKVQRIHGVNKVNSRLPDMVSLYAGSCFYFEIIRWLCKKLFCWLLLMLRSIRVN